MKYVLVCLWLLCYFPFVNSFVSDQHEMVVLYLENLQNFQDESSYQSWEKCLSFLDDNEINCCIRLECQQEDIDDTRFLHWISMLETRGHRVLHSPYCSCVRPVKMNYSESEREVFLDVDLANASLPICTSPESFRYQFKSQARKNEVLLVNGDPARWTKQQFTHFTSNIEYLIKLGIRFDTPLKSSL